MRFPTVTRPAECGGRSCELPAAQTERCNTHIKCPPGNAVILAIVGASGSELYSWEKCVTTSYAKPLEVCG